MSRNTIQAIEIPALLKAGKQFIDVRSPAEFASVHVEGAHLFPLDQLDPVAICQRFGTDSPLYILCQSGKRAEMAANKLTKAGHPDCVVVEGGTQAAINADVPVHRGKGVISLERQVRIVAGSLVFIGTALGYFIHPALFIIPAFIGAGLCFAGLTDTCGMGLMLSKCPWNKG